MLERRLMIHGEKGNRQLCLVVKETLARTRCSRRNVVAELATANREIIVVSAIEAALYFPTVHHISSNLLTHIGSLPRDSYRLTRRTVVLAAERSRSTRQIRGDRGRAHYSETVAANVFSWQTWGDSFTFYAMRREKSRCQPGWEDDRDNDLPR